VPFLLVVLILVSVGSIALATYLLLEERSRRQVVGRAIAGSDSSQIRQQIVRTSAKRLDDTLGGRILKRAPSVWSQNATIRQQLIQAGFDSANASMVYAALRVATLVGLPLLVLVLLPQKTFFMATVMVGAAAIAGLIAPVWYLHRSMRLRQEKIRRGLPDGIDLLVVCVEAGISLDAAILRVAKDLVYVHPDLARELLVVSRKTNAGVTREEALRGLWERTGVEEIRTLVTSLVQSEKWGSSSARVLRVASETLRRKRRHAAEKRAATAPIKMLVPMAILIFPALFVVILGPAVLNIIAGFSGK
jgi:tight adherence protein C